MNYAIDRRALARQGGLEYQLPSLPTDQYLPPGMPGFDDARIYPLRPNLAKARRLAGGERRTAVLYAYDFPPSPQLAEIVKSNLKAIGIDVEVKLFAKTVLFKRLNRKNEPYDMAINGWFVDYPDPADFLSQLDGRTLDQDSYLSGAFANLAKFDDPAFNRRLARGGETLRAKALHRLLPARARHGARRSPLGRLRQRDVPRLLLRPHRLPGLPARLRHRPRRALHPPLARLATSATRLKIQA